MAKKFTAHEFAMSIKEINSLKDKCVKLKHDSRKLNDQIASLRSLVKEMADALEYNECYRCTYNCSTCTCKDHKNALVAKAREVRNG